MYIGSKCDSTADSASEEVDCESEGSHDPEDSFSEEEVFEGYVHEDDLKSGSGQWEELQEEGVAKAKSQEVPLHVLRELKNVLTVRNSERDKRRMHRHGHRRSKNKQEVSHQVALQSHDLQSTSPIGQSQELVSHDHPLQSHDHQPSSKSQEVLQHDALTGHQVSQDDVLQSHDHQSSAVDAPPLLQHDHTPNQYPAAEIAAAIKIRRQKNTEHVFS